MVAFANQESYREAVCPTVLILGFLTEPAYLSFPERVVRISARHAPVTSSAAHKDDTVESALCGYPPANTRRPLAEFTRTATQRRTGADRDYGRFSS